MRLTAGWYSDCLSGYSRSDRHAARALLARFAHVESAVELWDLCAPVAWRTQSWTFRDRDFSSDYPASIEAAAVFCSLGSAIITAAQLALEVATRLAPWGQPIFSRVHWRFWPRDLWTAGTLPPMRWMDANKPLSEAIAETRREGPALDPLIRAAISGSAHDQRSMSLAITCARWELCLPTEANPFEPLLELLKLSFAITNLDRNEIEIALPDGASPSLT